jgi:thiamine biosynthesis protein ThiS
MQIRLNGESREIPDGIRLDQLIEEFRIQGRPIAVEINQQVVSTSRYDQTPLREGDQLEIVTFVGGG